jgi:hypothetical protein
MKKPKKYTHQQRMFRMEKVLTTYYVLIQSMQKRIDTIEKKLGLKKEEDGNTV